MMINCKLLTRLTAIACLSFGLTGCPDCDPPKTSFHVYMVFAPIDDSQRKLAQQFIANTKENINGKTQIIIAGHNNYYTVGEICQGDRPDFLNPKQPVNDPNDIGAVTNTIEKSLKNNKQCNATAKALVNLSTNLNETANKYNEKLILFIQSPWIGSEIDEKTLKELKEGMEKLSQSDKIEKIILFGVNQIGNDRLAKSFANFNQNAKKFWSATDINQTITFLKSIRKDNICLNSSN